jgi:predicted kinase
MPFRDLPVVSLDALRAMLRIGSEDDQSTVIQTASELVREHLRARRPFVWNATNVTRTMREKIIGLSRTYEAHVAIHVIEQPFKTILR